MADGGSKQFAPPNHQHSSCLDRIRPLSSPDHAAHGLLSGSSVPATLDLVAMLSADHKNAGPDGAAPSGWARFRVVGAVLVAMGNPKANPNSPGREGVQGEDLASQSGQLVCRYRTRG